MKARSPIVLISLSLLVLLFYILHVRIDKDRAEIRNRFQELQSLINDGDKSGQLKMINPIG